MLKRIAAISFVVLYTFLVFGAALHVKTPLKAVGTAVCKQPLCKTGQAGDLVWQIEKKNLAPVKSNNNKQTSKSILSSLFSFEFPKLPLEDFFLAAQKALVEKLF